MLDTFQIQFRGAQDFKAYYDYDSVPLPAVKANLSQGMLDFNRLHHVAVSSWYQNSLGVGEPERYGLDFRKKIPAIRSKEMTFKLCMTLRECLTASPNLNTLQLHGLPLRESETLSLSPSIKLCVGTVQPRPRLGGTEGLNLGHGRPPLGHSQLKHPGAVALAQELAEVLLVKAVDLQKCDLSNEGAWSLLEALKSNSTLYVLDIRQRPGEDCDRKRVLMNTNGQSSQALAGCRQQVGGVQVFLSSHAPAPAGVSHGALQNALDDRGEGSRRGGAEKGSH
ncbi:unnamed protein product [Coregonus sp. 'balchen']|nr:unnamed protein product [Coregonus sp. 'balchen']